jgi:hypothetical protein
MNQETEAGRLADDVKNVFTKAVQGNIDLANRISRLASDATREFSASVQRKSLPSPLESLTRIAEFNLTYWSALAEHSLAFANDLAGAAERALGIQCRVEEKAPMAIEVSGHPGQTAVAGFHVENTFSDPLDVTFEAGELQSAHGGTLKPKSVVFTPKKVTLAPRTQSVVQVSIEIPGECKPGESYLLPVKPVGFAMKQFSIKLNITAPAPKPEKAARASAAPDKTRKGDQ